MSLPPQAVLLRQRQLQHCGLRPGDAVLVPQADKQSERPSYCVCVAWPDDTPEFGSSPLAQDECGRGSNQSILADGCRGFDIKSFDPCVRLSDEVQAAAACESTSSHSSHPRLSARVTLQRSMCGLQV